MTKTEIRRQYLQMRQQLDPEIWQKNNQIISEKVIALIQKNHWTTIGIFWGVNQEVATKEIIEFCWQNQIQVYLPYCFTDQKTMVFKLIKNSDQDLTKNPQLKIFQPHQNCPDLEQANTLEALFIPLVAFDQQLNRIGMGAGYYDRWINTNDFSNWKIGLAQSWQLTQQLIPVEAHDVKLDFCLTESSLVPLLKR